MTAAKTTDSKPVAEPEPYIPDGATDEQLEQLGADTPEDEIHSRALTNKAGMAIIGKDGQPMSLDYVTARFVQDRLDATLGGARWQSVFSDLPDGSVRCGIGILVQRNDSADWVWKYDVGIPSTIEAVKGAHSDAFKRAGVQWGIARDLYDERDGAAQETVATAAQIAAPRPTIVQQVAAVDGTDGAPAGSAPWVCPDHNEVKVVPGGLSRRTGRRYNAFYACPEPGCDQTGPTVK